MLAVPGPLPADNDTGWAFEVKWDGVRALITTDGPGPVRLVSRNGNDLSVAYPELIAAAMPLAGRETVLDGEIVVLGADGRPDFGLLQTRMGVTDGRRAARLAAELPVHLVLFDVLRLDGRSLLHRTYEQRRAALGGLAAADGPGGPFVSVPPALDGTASQAWRATGDAGLEGVVAKRRTAPYTPGVRSSAWRKTKHVRTLDVVVGGWTPLRGATGAELPGALQVGVVEGGSVEGGRLRWAGSVGSGLDERERRELAGYLRVLARGTSPFDGPVDVPGVRWVHPRLVAEVTFTAWTSTGRLRHPVWHRLRPDLTRLD